MRTELQTLQHELDVTTVYVTHDQTEAMAMGDRIAVMNDGKLQQVGTAEAVYRSPVNEFVADFIGSPSINVFDVRVDGDRLVGPGGFEYRLSDTAPVEGYDRVRAGVRPEDIDLVPDGIAVETNVLEPMGNENFLYATLGDREITARISATARPGPGDVVTVDFAESSLYLFDPDTGESLKTKTDGESGDGPPPYATGGESAESGPTSPAPRDEHVGEVTE
jgi:multiple sugar transport system ATP-binding protein